MAGRRQPPTIRLRRLAAELRRLRDSAGLTREEVGEQTNINHVTLYRLETARVRPQVRTLTALLDIYNVEETKRDELIKLLRESGQRGWLQAFHASLPEQYTAYISFEGEADAVWNYESSFIPGLLQTEDYADAVIAGTLPEATPAEISSKIDARMRRQEVLKRDPALKLWAIIDEAVLQRHVGTASIRREQMEHLVELLKLRNVQLQVIPFDAGPHPGMLGSFATLKFDDDGSPDVVYIESGAGDLFLEDEASVNRYNLTFEHLRAAALSPPASAALITAVLDEI